jgi:molecular chaperone DnaK (HSP70)
MVPDAHPETPLLGLQQPKLVLVADFGGGTSEFSVVRLTSSASEVEVLGARGHQRRGDVFDVAPL